MKKAEFEMKKRLEELLNILSYTTKNGWLYGENFKSAKTHRFALSQAKESMQVAGVFCLQDTNGVNATPLVYVALANNRAEAQAIHRKVWSQGLVPFLVILTPTEILVCEGFNYSGQNWDQFLKTIDLSDLLKESRSPRTSKTDCTPLLDLTAIRLRSSIFWRDHAISVSGRVDQRLLDGLEGLSWSLKNGAHVSSKLEYSAANGLIGKLLYVFFLSDRGIINREWLLARGHSEIDLENKDLPWSKKALWMLLDDLDSIFNGSIFPLLRKDRATIDHTHIALVRSIIKHGSITAEGAPVQLSFLDIDLGVLRVETLSAVYEQFLENVEDGERRKVGAYYTPPFLVDLVLNRVEEECELTDGTVVMDPAAGSGVFLVGAYRRIIENARSKLNTELPIDVVRDLLKRNIFGIERNRDACHVAAFSLYLTMLDYVNPRDLTRIAAGQDQKKLFPSLVGENLFAQDFFARTSSLPIPKIGCILGNPPWQSIAKLESAPAETWIAKNPTSPIGNDQAAELFLWKALREHMAPRGILAMLIPAKSFVNPTSAKFRAGLVKEFSIIGAINFSHLRHKLFAGAKHACACVFVRNELPRGDAKTWVFSPLSISQPVSSREDWPWTLIMDSSAVQSFRQQFFAESPRSWFEVFMLRPVDRQIQGYIKDSARAKQISLLGPLCESAGAVIKRGGSAVETGLDPKYLADDLPSIDKSIDTVAQKTLDLFPAVERLTHNSSAKITVLPKSQIAKIKSTYKNQFSGNILLVPRNFRDIRFVEQPKAYSSSFLAVFFDKAGSEVTTKEKNFLRALEKYLKSKTALYFVATTGRRWLLDRRNVEPADFAAMPIPMASLDDDKTIKELLKLDGDELESYILAALGLSGDLKNSINEFLRFRMHFQDGNVPDDALAVPKAAMLTSYAKVMHRCLDGLVGRKGAFKVSHQIEPDYGVGIVLAQFSDEGTSSDDSVLRDICAKAVDFYRESSSNSFNNSLSITFDAATTTVCMTKPLEFFRWTIDSAYTDSRNVMNAFVKG